MREFDHSANYGCCFSYCVRARNSSKIGGHLDPAPKMGRHVCHHRNTLLPTYVTILSLVALGQTVVGVGMGPKNFMDAGPAPLRWDICDQLKTCSSPLHCKYDRSRSNAWCIIAEILHRVLPFKVTQDHWNRHGSIGYL